MQIEIFVSAKVVDRRTVQGSQAYGRCCRVACGPVNAVRAQQHAKTPARCCMVASAGQEIRKAQKGEKQKKGRSKRYSNHGRRRGKRVLYLTTLRRRGKPKYMVREPRKRRRGKVGTRSRREAPSTILTNQKYIIPRIFFSPTVQCTVRTPERQAGVSFCH
jgi:hypothetical protein